MKKLIIVGFTMLALSRGVFASTIADQFSVALLGHVETVTETTANGKTNVELLATPIQIGSFGGEYIAGIDGGVLGDVAPAPGQGGFAWTVGIHAHLSPILKKYVFTNISPAYSAINAIELNPRISLDFVDGHKVGVFGFAVGFAFGLNPIP